VRDVFQLPSLRETLLYLRNNGPTRAAAKFLSGYFAGRQRWHMTFEDVTRYLGEPLDAGGYELRFATRADLPLMDAFARRIAPAILATWCGPGYFFFVALNDGRPVAYRCLSRLVHPGVVGFVRLRTDQIFMVDEYTVPALRRRGLTRRMAIAMTPALVAHGYREVLGIHRVDNHATIAATRAKGIPRLGVVSRFRLPGRVWFAFDPAPDRRSARPGTF
jgi:hypothetical protein